MHIIKLILTILLATTIGCSSTTAYLYKSDTKFGSAHLKKNPNIGIAVIGNNIPGLNSVVETDTTKFTEHFPLTYYNLSDNIIFNSDRSELKNYDDLNQKFPDIKFVMVVLQKDPKIKYDYKTDEEDDYDNRTYTTTYSVPCEISLFNIKDKFLIAKSKHTFRQSKENYEEDMFSNHTLFGFLGDLLFPSEKDKSKFPVINYLEASILESYFYYFLKHIDYTDKVDYEYLFKPPN